MTTYRGTPAASLSRGRKFYAIRYIVGWPERGVIKVGSSFGKRRAYDYAITGGDALLVDYYATLTEALAAERNLWRDLRGRYPMAFTDKESARELIPRGGWMECLAIPVSDWGPALWPR